MSAPQAVLRSLSVLAHADGFTHYLYRSTGDGREALEPGFWTAARDLLTPGDIAFVTGPRGAVQIQFDVDLRPRLMALTAPEARAYQIHPSHRFVDDGYPRCIDDDGAWGSARG